MLADHTRVQIKDITIDRHRPMIVCDVDEVVVHFIRGLEDYLVSQGYRLHTDSFALNGNIRSMENQEPAGASTVRQLIMGFFEAHTLSLEPIAGAIEALAALAMSADIIMLTNLPDVYRKARMENLAAHGMHYPVITNDGPKGPALRALAGDHLNKVVFIDDSPPHLQSVAEHTPDVHLVHFLQDERFGKHAGGLDIAGLRSDNWSDTRAHIEALLA